MKNKKAEEGVEFLGYRTVNWIITGIVVLLLLVIVGSLVLNYFSSENTDLNRGKKTLDDIFNKVIYVEEGAISESLIIYSPPDWYLRSDAGHFIDNVECFKESCLCICENLECSGENKICKGFDFSVEVDESVSTPSTVPVPVTVNSGDKVNNAMRLTGLEKLRIVLLENKKVVIRREE